MELLPLERRLLLSAAPGTDGFADAHVPELCCCPACRGFAVVQVQANALPASAQAGAQPTVALSSLPQLSSRPAAPAKLYLDFNGDPSNHNTPAFDQDGDVTTFTTSELAAIREIWTRVAEKYSPFNINVTTVDPGTLPAGKVMRVLIGGDGSWYGQVGGLGYVGGFRMSGYNTAWVFSKNMANGVARYTAEAVAHEAGHGFGLQHQSVYEGNAKVEEYNEGTATIAPVMGVSYYATRGLWWSGPSISAAAIQTDASIIASAVNGFGYRPDDHPSSLATAEPLAVNSGRIAASGVIEVATDTDYFAFQSGAGTISLTLGVAEHGATLDGKLVLQAADGRIIATSDSADLGTTLSASVPAGAYRIAVASHGGYGDVGQYTLAGTVPIVTVTSDHTPASLSVGTVANKRIAVRWADNSTGESGFVIERQADTGPWIQVGIAGKNTTSYIDTGVQPARNYRYRVSAFGPGFTMGPSEAVQITTATNAPSGLSAAPQTQGAIALTWKEVMGEQGYRIERSTDGVTWVQAGTTSANNAAFNDALITGGASYEYRVRAFNSIGDSSPSNIARVTAPASAVATTAIPTLKPGDCFSSRPVSNWWPDADEDDEASYPVPTVSLELQQAM